MSLMVRSSTPLRAVDDHQRRVDRGQRAVGILGEVLVTGRVEQIDDAAIEGKLHHRGGNGDAALLLQAHPIGGGVPGRLAALHRSGHLDGAAEQQQLFRQRGLARVGMGDDGESPSTLDFIDNFRVIHRPFPQACTHSCTQNTIYSSQLGWHTWCYRPERLGLSPSSIIAEPRLRHESGWCRVHVNLRDVRGRGFKSCHPDY